MTKTTTTGIASKGSWAAWALIVVSMLVTSLLAPGALKWAAPVGVVAGLAWVLRIHAARRGGWDLVSPIAVLGVAALVLLVVAIAAFWSVSLATNGFAD